MAESFKIIRLDSVESTNTYARSLDPDTADTTPLVVITDCQTAGRGQRGNSWESESGSNLTFSLVLYPRWMAPARQFELSMQVSIGIVNALRGYVDTPEWLSIKWPNDIYFGDRKMAGILIENSLGQASIERSVVGIGLNVNQKVFHSDAPNPISLSHATGFDIDRDTLLTKVVNGILDMVDSYESDPEPDELGALYNNMLWRHDGEFHRWQDTATGKVFSAVLEGVALDGRLTLLDHTGTLRTYLFKEVRACLTRNVKGGAVNR